MENNGWTLEPRKRNVTLFLVNHVETATEISAGVLLLTSLASFQPQEAGELCEFDESMGNAMFVSHQWVTGRKFSHNAGNQFILWCACASFFLHWHTVLYCTITIYEPLTLQNLQESIYNWTHQSCDFRFFFNGPHGPMSRIYPKVTSHHPDPELEQLAVLQRALKNLINGKCQVSLRPALELTFGRLKCPKCTGLQSE